MSLQIVPNSSSLRANQPQVFQAAGASGEVTWSRRPEIGSIDRNGVYTAPKVVLRNSTVTVVAQDGTQSATAAITLDPGGFWIQFLGAYWLGWAAVLIILLYGYWETLCPNCRSAELLVSPPLATVTAWQTVRFTATAPVSWQDTTNSSGLYIAPQTTPPNPNVNITAVSTADAKKTASASLIWSPDIGIILQPQSSTVVADGKIHVNAVVTAAPNSPANVLAGAVVEWLQPAIGKVTPTGNRDAVYESGPIRRATSIMLMANVRGAGTPPRAAGTYITLLPLDPAKACRDDFGPNLMNLIALIAAAGALGGLIHGASSFAIFAGNREFKSSWTWWYVLRPVLGAAVALVVYLVFRTGLGSTDVSLLGTDCLKIAGFAGLIGMFAEPATLKLKDIFNTLFTPRDDQRKDRLAKTPASPQPPQINSIDPTSTTVNAAATLKITGANFAAGCIVQIGTTARTPRIVSATALSVDLQPDDIANAGDVPIRVCNTPPNSDCSNSVTLKVV